MLSFRRKLKDAVRSTITGIDITKIVHQRALHEESRGLLTHKVCHDVQHNQTDQKTVLTV